MKEPDKFTYHAEEEPRTLVYPRARVVQIDRDTIKQFIMDDADDFVDFMQRCYEAEVDAYLCHHSEAFDEWIDCRIRGEG